MPTATNNQRRSQVSGSDKARDELMPPRKNPKKYYAIAVSSQKGQQILNSKDFYLVHDRWIFNKANDKIGLKRHGTIYLHRKFVENYKFAVNQWLLPSELNPKKIQNTIKEVVKRAVQSKESVKVQPNLMVKFVTIDELSDANQHKHKVLHQIALLQRLQSEEAEYVLTTADPDDLNYLKTAAELSVADRKNQIALLRKEVFNIG